MQQRRLSSGILVLTLGLGVSLSCPAEAEDPHILLERVYKMADYGAAAKLAGECIGRKEDDVLARFYLANSLVKLGHRDEAIAEYKRCMSYGAGTHVESAARNAILALQNTSASKAINQGGAGSQAKELTATGEDGKLQLRLNGEIERRRKNLLEREAQEKKALLDRFDQEVKRIQAEGRGPGDEVVKARTKNAFDRMTAESNTIEQHYRKEADELLKLGQNMNARSGDENASRLVPTGSGMYLQNYEHLDDGSAAVGLPSENPLTAIPGKLVNTPKANSGKSVKMSPHTPKRK